MSTILRTMHFVAIVSAASVLSVNPRTSLQRPTFSVKVDLVRVDVSVTRKNLPVRGLTTADFVLSDNGVKQTLQPLSVEEVPLEAWLVLDASNSVRPALSQLVQAASFFVAGLAPRDRAALVTFSEKVLVRQRPTSDFGAVRRALASLQPSGITALYDATYAALRLRRPGAGRGVAVVLTDGYDNISWLTADQVVASAERSDVVVYGVAVNGVPTVGSTRPVGRRREPSDTPQYRYLRRLTDSTGGRVFDATWSELEQTFGSILKEIRARYILSYYPTSTTPGWHKLEVRLARGHGDVRARPGYYVQPVGQERLPEDQKYQGER